MSLTVTAIYVHGERGFDHDDEVRRIMDQHGGKHVGSGTFMPTDERDVQYDFGKESSALKCADELRAKGYRTLVSVPSSDLA